MNSIIEAQQTLKDEENKLVKILKNQYKNRYDFLMMGLQGSKELKERIIKDHFGTEETYIKNMLNQK